MLRGRANERPLKQRREGVDTVEPVDYNVGAAVGVGRTPNQEGEVIRFGKGDREQARRDQRVKAWNTWCARQYDRAQVQRDWAHKREVRAFYASKRKKAKERRQ